MPEADFNKGFLSWDVNFDISKGIEAMGPGGALEKAVIDGGKGIAKAIAEPLKNEVAPAIKEVEEKMKAAFGPAQQKQLDALNKGIERTVNLISQLKQGNLGGLAQFGQDMSIGPGARGQTIGLMQTQLKRQMGDKQRLMGMSGAPGGEGVKQAQEQISQATEQLSLNMQELAKTTEEASKAQQQMVPAADAAKVALEAEEKAKSKLHVNLQQMIPVIKEWTQTSSEMGAIIQGEVVGALESADVVFNKVFIDTLTKSQATGASFGAAMKASFGAAGIAAKQFGQLTNDNAKEIAKSMGLSERAARKMMEVLQQSQNPVKALAAAEKEELLIKKESIQISLQLAAAVEAQIDSFKRKAKAVADAAQREQLAIKQSEEALRGEFKAALAGSNAIIDARARVANATIQSLNSQAAAQQSFIQTLGKTESITVALSAAETAQLGVEAKLTEQVKQLAKMRGISARSAKVLLDALVQSKSATQALAAVEKDELAVRKESISQAVIKIQLEQELMDFARQRAKAVQESARQSALAVKQSEEALRGEFKTAVAGSNLIVDARNRMAQAILASINPAIASQQAFNQTLGQTGSIASATIVAINANAKAEMNLSKAATEVAKSLSITNKQATMLIQLLQKGVNPVRAFNQAMKQGTIVQKKFGDAIDKTNKFLGRIGVAFAALFVVQRITDFFKGLIGAIVTAAQKGAEFEAVSLKLRVISDNMGESFDETRSKVEQLSERFLTQKTVVTALATLLQSGLNLDQATTRIREFEEAALSTDLSLKGLNERIIQASEAFRDRMSRTLGKTSGLQTNFGQALRIVTNEMDKLNSKIGKNAAVNTLAAESLKFHIALSNEFNGLMGLMAALTNTTTGQLALFDKAVENLHIQIGSALSPVLGALLKVINESFLPKIIEWVAKNQDLVRSIAIVTVVIAALVVVLGTAALAVVSFAFAFSFGPITAVIVAILALIGAAGGLTVAIRGPEQALKDFAFIAGFLLGLIQNLGNLVKFITREFQNFGRRLNNTFQNIIEFIVLLGQLVVTAFDVVIKTFVNVDKAAAKTSQSIFTEIANRINKILNKEELEEVSARSKRFEEILREMSKRTSRGFFLLSDAVAVLVNDINTLQRGMMITGDTTGATTERLNLLRDVLSFAQNERGLSLTEFLIEAGIEGKIAQEVLEGFLLTSKEFKLGQGGRKGVEQPFGTDGAADAQRLQRAFLRLGKTVENLGKQLRSVTADVFFSDSLRQDMVDFEQTMDKVFDKVTNAAIGTKLVLSSIFEEHELPQFTRMVDKFVEQAERLRGAAKQLEDQFFRGQAREEIRNLQQFTTLNIQARKRVARAEAEGMAENFALQLDGIEEMGRRGVLSAKEVAMFRVAIEKEAAFKIRMVFDEIFDFQVKRIRELGSILIDELSDALDIIAQNQREIDEARAISQTKLRELELINDIRRTEQAERIKAAQIIFVQQQTAEEIKRIQQETTTFSQRIWNRFVTSLERAIIERIVTNAIENKLLPALGESLGGAGDFLKGAEATIQQGKDLADSLSALPDIATKLEQLGNVELLSLEVLRDIKAIISGLPDPSALRAPNIGPGGPGQLPADTETIPGGSVPKGVKDAQDEVEEASRNLVKDLEKLTLVVGSAIIGMELLGVETPKAIRLFVAAMAAALTALRVGRAISDLLSAGSKASEGGLGTANEAGQFSRVRVSSGGGTMIQVQISPSVSGTDLASELTNEIRKASEEATVRVLRRNLIGAGGNL